MYAPKLKSKNIRSGVKEYLLAKHKAAVTPIKPKNGAEVGQVSRETVLIFFLFFYCVIIFNTNLRGTGMDVSLRRIDSDLFYIHKQGRHPKVRLVVWSQESRQEAVWAWVCVTKENPFSAGCVSRVSSLAAVQRAVGCVACRACFVIGIPNPKSQITNLEIWNQ